MDYLSYSKIIRIRILIEDISIISGGKETAINCVKKIKLSYNGFYGICVISV